MPSPDFFGDDSRPPEVPKPMPRRLVPSEYKVIALRDCPTPAELLQCDTPQRAVDYWRLHIATSPQFKPDCECLAVLLLNTRLRVKGHQVVTVGLLDQVLTHAREVFRTAIVAAAHSIVLMHNHPSGDPSPSQADIRVTRELIRAGHLLRIEVMDHIVVGNPGHSSLRQIGCFHT